MIKAKIVVTDFDGTLADSNHEITEKNLETLHNLGKLGIPRVVATGRNMYSFNKAAPEDLPIDFVVFSTGAGIFDWKKKKLLHKNEIAENIVKDNAEMLIDEKKDFMLHLPIPDNHKFYYHRFHDDNFDFETRLSYYGQFAMQMNGMLQSPATQLLAVLHKNELDELERLTALTSGVKVIKTTSPITGKAIWMELFPEGVSKASGIKWVCDYLSVNTENVVVVGNDYNDLDMLRFTRHSYVVANSPEDLKSEFNTVPAVGENGFTEAVLYHI